MDTALVALSSKLTARYAHTGRPSVAGEKHLRLCCCSALQYSKRTLLMEQLDDNLPSVRDLYHTAQRE
jgi:hypothetical protein